MLTTKRNIKRILDLAMTILLLLLMAQSLVGETAHEWMGTIMGTLFLAHHVLNLQWYRGLTKGRWSLARTFQTTVNFALLFMMLGLMVSGINLSKHVFSFLPISKGRSLARTVHLLCSYWGFCLMSLHLGMRWNMVVNLLPRKIFLPIFRVLVGMIAGYGLWAFVQREVGNYMFLRSMFVFFDFEEPLILFLLDYLAILVLFAGIGYYLLKMFQKDVSKRCFKR